MSTDAQAQNPSHGHEGFPWKHVIGFLLSIGLTFLALWLVIGTSLSTDMTIGLIVTLAIFQVLVQLLFFMHLTERNAAYQITAIVFGLFTAFVIVIGSIWVMSFGYMM
ncbi:cytochrome aa3 quinol oxidase subunit IV [Tuberibacillus sp. Marseille-P3662]|uniref:cytochrome aa3 quinol oxidase subunit IV n=1 Tax=Tuberibacillus sp. Marseille-P3662 TaxID=1965358 RepID=UPI000A1C8E65|nr:cytochrome aa3 quinol oxidase subunit IV [Tuberibacillus sp. Marseille-P3662]